MSRDSMLMYRSFFESFSELPGDQYKHLMMSISAYAMDGIEPELTGMERALFILIRPQLDANDARYQNSLRGGRKKPALTGEQPSKAQDREKGVDTKQETTKEEPNTNQNETKHQTNVSVSDSANESVYENENENPNPEASPRPFSLQDELNPNRKDIMARIERARLHCLELGGPLASSARKLITHLHPDREPAIFATFASFTDSEIDQAIANLANIAANPAQYRDPGFRLLDGFLATGVEQFVDAARPGDRFRIQTRAVLEKVPSVEVPDAEETRKYLDVMRADGGDDVGAFKFDAAEAMEQIRARGSA